MGIAPDSILGEAVSTVTETISNLNQMANMYSSQLSAALSAISQIKVAEVSAPVRQLLPPISPPPVQLGEMPEFNVGELKMPTPPPDLTFGLVQLNLDGLDNIPSAPTPYVISVPDAPEMAQVSVPTKPNIDTSIEFPTAPTSALPEMETLAQINLPEFHFPELPTFDAVAPDVSGITVPSVFINWAEPVYESEVLEDLQENVKEMMKGGTGLPAHIEDALFSRARERDRAETNRQVQEAVDTWAARNYSMPPGMLVKQADVIREQGRVRAAETNRDIMVEAAKWEIENIRFAVQQGLALEQLTTNMFENTAKRLFEVARFQAEAQISVFNAQVSLFNAQNAAFETLAQVYRTKLDAALSKLTAYKTAVEGQVAVGQVNQQKVEVYKARLAAVQSSIEIYKAEMQGAQVRADTIKTQFDAYRADVQAYAEQISAEKVKFDAYDSRMKGEATKASVYDSQTRAYASTVQALGTRADVKMKAAQVSIEMERTRISKFLADVDAYKAQLEAGLREAQYNTTVYMAQVDGWKAKAAADVSNSEMLSRWADMTTRTNIAYAEMQITEFTAKMQNAVQQANIALEAAKAVGQYTAQLAAGALSAAHVSASISGSGSANSSDSNNRSESTNHNYNY